MSNPLSSLIGNNNVPIQLMKNLLSKSCNPRTMVLNYMKLNNNNNNPMISELIDMAERGETQNIEKIARDYFSNNGMDYDTVKQQFMENFKKN